MMSNVGTPFPHPNNSKCEVFVQSSVGLDASRDAHTARVLNYESLWVAYNSALAGKSDQVTTSKAR